MGDNLGPQFTEHAGFEKWTRNQEKTLREQHSVKQGAGTSTVYPPEVGRRVSQLRSSREMLLDFASMDYYSKAHGDGRMHMLSEPLHALLPESHHHLVDEYRRSR